ncbi:hypothetical protein [Novipirellula artificiosorum]|uniref:Uncharacterized protein n=1 Tax=Novipirellula artificiosorum TaxID=2528016 RepID=A0A5C6E622_9BACT|nr:hypothetical protein [Novipirellula artificiosorum]TWU42579.1 hypothetical protein Poly41_08760 [Novipirellula artificiosorum]
MPFSRRSISTRWHRLPISRQLLVLVNAILIGLVTIFLVVDYRIRMSRRINDKQIALTEEADGGDAIQELVDNVCARMNTDDSPGHHIAADWRGLSYQAVSHGHPSPWKQKGRDGVVRHHLRESAATPPPRDRIGGFFVESEFSSTRALSQLTNDRSFDSL